LKKIIETDQQITPFELVSAEQTYRRVLEIGSEGDIREVKIGGLIDRVDRVGEVLRVIDYKTGNAKTGFSSVDALFDGGLSSRNGAALQTLLYSWLVLEEHPGEQVSPGLYVMKSLYDPDFDPVLAMGSYSKRESVHNFARLEEQYLEKLKETLDRLFNAEVDFTQTENEAICRYCDFSKICSRQTIE